MKAVARVASRLIPLQTDGRARTRLIRRDHSCKLIALTKRRYASHKVAIFRHSESAVLILLVVLILGFGFGGYRMGPGLGYYGGGGLSLILTIVVVLLLLKVI